MPREPEAAHLERQCTPDQCRESCGMTVFGHCAYVVELAADLERINEAAKRAPTGVDVLAEMTKRGRP